MAVALRVLLLASLLLVEAVAFTQTRAVAPSRVTITRHFTPADQVSGRYQYIPFDVPQGAGQLHVAYTYDRANGDNVVDLGVFQPGSIELGTRVFRGYSGGARSEFTIDSLEATPGYIPGHIWPGQWHILLGLYKVAAPGVDVALTVDVTPGDDMIEMVDRAPIERPRTGQKWYLGALHTHTIHSDGTVSPVELMRQFREKGFDFVAITDHNNTTHTFDRQLEDQPLPLWIIGEEVTTPGGHASVWGLRPGAWVDFRVSPGDPRIRDLVRSAREQGGIFSINHPASECVACGWTHEIVDGIEGIEISNGRHGEVERAIAMWDTALATGRHLTGVGSSDWHSAPNPIDNANVRVYADSLTEDAILAAIRAGRVIVMTSAAAAAPEFVIRAAGKDAPIGGTLNVSRVSSLDVDVRATAAAGGRLIVVSNGQRGAPVAMDAAGVAHVEPRATPGYVRFELVAADGSPVAYTNPVYLVR